MTGREKKIDFIIGSLYIAVIILIVFLFIKFLLGPLLPFITAFITVSFSRKIILKIQAASHSKKFASMIFTLLLILILSLIIYGLFTGLLKELVKLSETLSGESTRVILKNIRLRLNQIFGSFSRYGLFSYLSGFISSFFDSFGKAVSEIVSTSLPSLMSYFFKFISFFPTAVIFLCLMFISMFYISCDYERICNFLLLQLSEKARVTFDETKSIIISTAKDLFKSYFLLTFITFLQLLSGFLIMGIDYALLSAGIICFVDLLPILGTGTVLIPWSGICFILGNYQTAVGLLVLYGSITLFRQIAEPRIVGANTGLSPLLSLISIFLGLRLMGVAGIVIFPIIVITITSLNKKGFIRIYKNFPEKKEDKILKTRTKFLNFKRHDNK